jgi:thiamine-monophosphate kinase
MDVRGVPASLPAGGLEPAVSESELLAHIYARSASLRERFPQAIVGPGHDCAVVAAPEGGMVLLKVDQLVEGRHFKTGTPLDLIARKAVARPVSDIAAAGGTPTAALAAVILPPGFAQADALFDAMARWAEGFGCPLVGGDIARGSDGATERRSDEGKSGLVLSVTVMGAPHAARGPVLRSGARVGDGLYVTGALGGSLDRGTGLGRHLTFEPRLAEARWLCDTLGAGLHAMMDISDGLGRDAARLAETSGVRVRIEAGAIPRSGGVADWRAAASEGEDYELLLAAGAAVPPRCPETGTAITRIGVIEAGAGCVIVEGGEGGREFDASGMGWEH